MDTQVELFCSTHYSQQQHDTALAAIEAMIVSRQASLSNVVEAVRRCAPPSSLTCVA